MTRNLRERLAKVNELVPPELWESVQRRVERGVVPFPDQRPPVAGGRQRLVAAVTAFAVFGAAALFAVRAIDRPAATGSNGAAGEWRALAPGPLSPRYGARAFWVGGRVVIIGGRDTEPCPPNADCAIPEEPPLRDGAAYDPASDTWRMIAPAPVPIGGVTGAVLNDRLYLWVSALDQRPEGRSTFISYDSKTDTWEELPLPPGSGPTSFLQLTATSRGVVAYPTSHENGVSPDFVFDPSEGTWRELPLDPLVPSFDRTMVWTGTELVLLAIEHVPQPGSDGPAVYRAAALDPGRDTWRRLPDSEIVGYDPVWFWSAGRIVNPTFGMSDGGEVNGYGRSYPHGGMLDPVTGTWSDLPPIPSGLGAYCASSVAGSGFVACPGVAVLDVGNGTWSPLPMPNAEQGEALAVWAGDRLVVWGAAEWTGSGWRFIDSGWSWRIPDEASGAS